MKASRFGGPHSDAHSLVLSFPRTPPTCFDNISLSYGVKSKTTNVFIGELYYVKDGPQAHDFIQMLDAYEAYWAHPLLVPVMLLDILMSRLEVEIFDNIDSVEIIERTVSRLQSSNIDAKPLAAPVDMTHLLTELHGNLKYAIKLVDAARWMQKTVALLLEFGQDLDKITPDGTPGVKQEWREIKKFLEDLERLTAHLEPDPVMTQQRCQSQIDILYGKIAQEDNLLAARLAVSSTRDSSAMKALAVITALFLPGTYIATLFSMSMFNWQGLISASSTSTADGNSSSTSQHGIVMPYIWIYCVVSAILTAIVILGWRLWWVKQDREFHRQLPKLVRTSAFQ